MRLWWGCPECSCSTFRSPRRGSRCLTHRLSRDRLAVRGRVPRRHCKRPHDVVGVARAEALRPERLTHRLPLLPRPLLFGIVEASPDKSRDRATCRADAADEDPGTEQCTRPSQRHPPRDPDLLVDTPHRTTGLQICRDPSRMSGVELPARRGRPAYDTSSRDPRPLRLRPPQGGRRRRFTLIARSDDHRPRPPPGGAQRLRQILDACRRRLALTPGSTADLPHRHRAGVARQRRASARRPRRHVDSLCGHRMSPPRG